MNLAGKQFSVWKSFLSLKRNLESVNFTIEKNCTIQRRKMFLEKCFSTALQFLHTKTVFWEVVLYLTVKRALWTYVTANFLCCPFLWLPLGTRLMWTYFVRKVSTFCNEKKNWDLTTLSMSPNAFNKSKSLIYSICAHS